MLLSLSATLSLAATCAPQVAPQILAAIVQVESGFNPLALGINGAPQMRRRPGSRAEAVNMARTLIAAGRSVDLGLAQLNSRNLHRLGLTVDEAFDPCRNVAAAGRLLSSNYAAERSRHPNAQTALRAALSRYNTGHATRGLTNGYVARVTAAAFGPAPAPSTTPNEINTTPALPENAAPPAPAWDVFARAQPTGSLLTRAQTPNPGDPS